MNTGIGTARTGPSMFQTQAGPVSIPCHPRNGPFRHRRPRRHNLPPRCRHAVRQRPPSGTAGQAAAFWLGWLPLGILLMLTLIGMPIFIGVTARRLGYRGHDWLMLFIPYYGPYAFM